MKFLIDADTPYSLIQVINSYGHASIHAGDVLKFATDREIFDYANKNRLIIITKDLGFAEMFMETKGFGLILIRLPYYFTASKIAKAFEQFLKNVGAEELEGAITVLELGRYRTKKFI